MSAHDFISEADEYLRNTAQFGESVSYTPFNGMARSIDVKIRTSKTIEIDSVDTETRLDTIAVRCKRDGTDGIDLPNFGDQIVRSAPFDSDARPYVYTATEDRNQTRDHWTLTFSRKRRQAEGFK